MSTDRRGFLILDSKWEQASLDKADWHQSCQRFNHWCADCSLLVGDMSSLLHIFLVPELTWKVCVLEDHVGENSACWANQCLLTCTSLHEAFWVYHSTCSLYSVPWNISWGSLRVHDFIGIIWRSVSSKGKFVVFPCTSSEQSLEQIILFFISSCGTTWPTTEGSLGRHKIHVNLTGIRTLKYNGRQVQPFPHRL